MDSFTNILSGMSRYESKLQFVEGEKAQLHKCCLTIQAIFIAIFLTNDCRFRCPLSESDKNSIQYQINAVNVDTKSRENL